MGRPSQKGLNANGLIKWRKARKTQINMENDCGSGNGRSNPNKIKGCLCILIIFEFL